MQIIRNYLAILSLIYLAVSEIGAQSNTLTTGGNASASSGSVSYSIGQIDFISASGTTGNLNQGLQQPFEFYIITGIHDDGISLNISLYPNPVEYFISLEVDLADLTKLSYQLFNLKAQLLESNGIQSRKTLIDMRSLLNGYYILKITKNQQEIKSFKIIKNQ